MLYETLFQQKILLCTIYFGIVSGIVFDVLFVIQKLLGNKKVANILLEILFCIISALLFWQCVQTFNFGRLRLFEFVGFCLGLLIERQTLHKLLEKYLQLTYNLFGKVFAKVKKSKLLSKIFK